MWVVFCFLGIGILVSFLWKISVISNVLKVMVSVVFQLKWVSMKVIFYCQVFVIISIGGVVNGVRVLLMEMFMNSMFRVVYMKCGDSVVKKQ